MKLSWKLLPVAALFALGVGLISLPAGPVQAYNISVPASMALNTPTAVSVGIDAGASRNISFTASGNGFFVSSPSAPTANNVLGTVAGSGSTTLTFTEDGTSIARTLTAYFNCTQAGTVTFFLFVNQSLSAQGTTTCGTGGTGTGALSIATQSTVLAQGAQGSYTASVSTVIQSQYVTISANPALVTFGQPNIVLNGLGVVQDSIFGQNTNNLTIIANQPGNRTITGTFICSQQGTATLTITMAAAAGVAGTSAYSQQIICGTGLVTPTVGLASSVTVAASPTTVACNGTAFVTVTVRNSVGGYVADGTSVSLNSSMGSLSPTTATTLGGGVLAVFTAPSSQSGTATIQASAAGTTQGSASITVNCNAATPTPAIPPTIFVPPSTGGATGTISPPNTGDAGLADNNVWQLYAGIALIVMSAAGAAAVVRTRA